MEQTYDFGTNGANGHLSSTLTIDEYPAGWEMMKYQQRLAMEQREYEEERARRKAATPTEE